MKSVLVVGTSGGIGNKATELLLTEGYKVFGTYYQHPDHVANLTGNQNFVSRQLDIKSPESIKKLKQSITEELFAIINCAGIVKFETGDLDNDISVWDETMAVNLSGNYYLGKIFSDQLLPGGRFIMISSTDSYFGGEQTAAYAASKSSVNSLTKSLSLVFKNKQILVNSIAPGWVKTPMTEINGDAFLNQIASLNPLKRIAESIDVANVISFLLSEKAGYLNGQTITLDGGYTNQDPTLLIEQETKP